MFNQSNLIPPLLSHTDGGRVTLEKAGLSACQDKAGSSPEANEAKCHLSELSRSIEGLVLLEHIT